MSLKDKILFVYCFIFILCIALCCYEETPYFIDIIKRNTEFITYYCWYCITSLVHKEIYHNTDFTVV